MKTKSETRDVLSKLRANLTKLTDEHGISAINSDDYIESITKALGSDLPRMFINSIPSIIGDIEMINDSKDVINMLIISRIHEEYLKLNPDDDLDFSKFEKVAEMANNLESNDTQDACNELLLILGNYVSRLETEGGNDPEFTKVWSKIQPMISYSEGTIDGVEVIDMSDMKVAIEFENEKREALLRLFKYYMTDIDFKYSDLTITESSLIRKDIFDSVTQDLKLYEREVKNKSMSNNFMIQAASADKMNKEYLSELENMKNDPNIVSVTQSHGEVVVIRRK